VRSAWRAPRRCISTTLASSYTSFHSSAHSRPGLAVFRLLEVKQDPTNSVATHCEQQFFLVLLVIFHGSYLLSFFSGILWYTQNTHRIASLNGGKWKQNWSIARPPAHTRLAENAGRKIAKTLPSARHHTSLSGHIFANKAHVDNRKNFLNSNIASICNHNMVDLGPLTAEIRWRVWGTPANFNGFRVLAVLLHGTLVVGVNQTLRRWTEGATYIRQGGHHVGHWPTF